VSPYGELERAWLSALESELPAAVRLRQALHAEPELSGAEERTAAAVAERFEVPAQPVAGTGRVLRLGPPGPAVAVRAELDALPLHELTGAPYAASNGAMHACGHDVHLAALAALGRASRGLDLPFGLVVLLQPREEVGPTGAQDVIASGVLAAHEVRAMIGAHVQPLVPVSAVAADPGPVNAAVDEIEIVVTGRGGHGGYPHLAVDPVPALCAVVLALQDAVRATVDAMEPAVVSVTQLAGAGAPNVIPGTATAAGTVRTMRPEVGRPLHERLRRTVESVAAGYGCTGRISVRRGEPALVNDPVLAAAAGHRLRALGVPQASFRSCGSDDFATYGTVLPILMLFVGTGEGPGGPTLHDPRYLPGDGAVGEVARALLAGWLAAAETLLLPT